MSHILRTITCVGLIACTTTAHASLPPNLSRYHNLSKVTPYGYSLRQAPIKGTQVHINGKTVQLSPQQSEVLAKALTPLIQRAAMPLLRFLPLLVGQRPLPDLANY